MLRSSVGTIQDTLRGFLLRIMFITADLADELFRDKA